MTIPPWQLTQSVGKGLIQLRGDRSKAPWVWLSMFSLRVSYSMAWPYELCLNSLCHHLEYRYIPSDIVLRYLVVAFLKQVLDIKNCILQEVGTKGTVDVLPSLNQKELAVCHGHHFVSWETCASVLSGQHERMSNSFRNTSKEAWRSNIEHWYAELYLSST